MKSDRNYYTQHFTNCGSDAEKFEQTITEGTNRKIQIKVDGSITEL